MDTAASASAASANGQGADFRRARKRPITVEVAFAKAPGAIDTLEGRVRYVAGAALIQGPLGDRWPVERSVFDSTYEPLAGLAPGEGGTYRKRPLLVRARRLEIAEAVRVGSEQDLLQGRPGDWLVEYQAGHNGIVSASIFEATYELVEGEESDASLDALHRSSSRRR